ncbi:hypothetical protein [Methanobacterium sp.]|uniref:hypothetical protein n=1 Tax=Methanobacterium sp. TaxID=2164 RepID=UPI003C76E76F
MKKQIKPKTQVILLLLSIFVITVSISSVSASPLPASTQVYVATNGSDTNMGTAESPYLTIQKGVDSVSEDGTVYIANGVYNGTNNTNITLTKSMNITGQSQTGTIINGTGTNWIFIIPNGLTVTIQNLTLTNTNPNGNGGAVNNGGTLTLTNCTFTNNTADYGGAIYNSGIINNLINCIFINNTAYYYGGAIENEGATINNITQCTFINNTAKYYGGAIDGDGPIGNITDSIFTDNSAAYGGSSIDNYDASIDNVTGCIFTGNTASYYGGVISNWYAGSTINAHFNTFTNTGSTSAIFCYENAFTNATNNWWGTNNPDFNSLISTMYGGSVDTSNWLYMNITSELNMYNGGHNNVTVNFNNAYNGTTITNLNPANGHIPDGTVVKFSSGLGSFYPTIAPTVNGIVTSLFTANQTGTGNLTATTDNQTVTQILKVNPASYLYLKVTSSKNNPTVGETFIITYKLGNNGPDNATNVIISIPIPKNFKITNISGDGNWTYNPTTSIITWTLSNVTVGDPYLYVTGKTMSSGVYVFGSNITSETYNLNTQGVTPITVTSTNPINPINPTNPTTNTKLNAETTKIPMQHTGLPIAGLILAILAVIGGSISSRRK